MGQRIGQCACAAAVSSRAIGKARVVLNAAVDPLVESGYAAGRFEHAARAVDPAVDLSGVERTSPRNLHRGVAGIQNILYGSAAVGEDAVVQADAVGARAVGDGPHRSAGRRIGLHVGVNVRKAGAGNRDLLADAIPERALTSNAGRIANCAHGARGSGCAGGHDRGVGVDRRRGVCRNARLIGGLAGHAHGVSGTVGIGVGEGLRVVTGKG